MTPINILIAESRGMILNQITKILSTDPDIHILRSVINEKHLFSYLSENVPDILILDIDILGENVVQTLRKTCKMVPDTYIIVLGDSEDQKLIKQIIRADAAGYLLIEEGIKELPAAIDAVLNGKQYLCENSIQTLVKNDTSEIDSSTSSSNLTEREIEVLIQICRELTNREIGEKLGISVRTVDAHRRHLLQKTGAKNTAGLVRYAIRNNIVDF